MSTVPGTFPRDPFPSAVPGAQPKFSARLINGKYVVGLTDEELQARYEMCADLVKQLTADARQKLEQMSTETLEAYLDRLEQAIRTKEWGMSPVEITWVFQQLRTQL